MKVSFHTLGCRLNQAESSTLVKSFRQRHYQIVPFTEAADVCVINTCTVTETSDAKNRQAIRAAYRKNPQVCIAVVGCYSQVAAEALWQMEGVRLVIGNAEKLNLPRYIEKARQSRTPLVINPKIRRATFKEPVFPHPGLSTRSCLKIQDGCDFMCSFCIIPFSRGRGRSRQFENLLEDARSFIEAGSKEIVITGVNIGTYADSPYGLPDVIDALQEQSELARIRISSIEPTTVPESLLERMADPCHKLVPFLHLPLQSGSNTILSQMKRRYCRESYRGDVLDAFERVPGLCIGTDVMVGFPGESDDDFEQTFQLLDSLPLAYFHVFPFSERKGTSALRLKDKVKPEVKKRRAAMLRELSLQKRKVFYETFVGTTRPVLFETPDDMGEISGYTDNYIRVVLSPPFSPALQNNIFPVYCTETHQETMRGILVD